MPRPCQPGVRRVSPGSRVSPPWAREGRLRDRRVILYHRAVAKTQVILVGLSLTIVLLSLNRLTSLTSGHLQPHEFLRWLDLNAMLPIPLLSVVLYYLLKRQVAWDARFRQTVRYTLLGMLFIAGAYLFGAGSGAHEVTNYLNTRFCERGDVSGSLCDIVAYNDDEFSHYVYYAGFLALNISLMLMEFFMPRREAASRTDLSLIFVNSLFIASGMFANLAFEETRLDLVFFASVMALALGLLLLGKRSVFRLPVVFYFASAYTLGVASTILYKITQL